MLIEEGKWKHNQDSRDIWSSKMKGHSLINWKIYFAKINHNCAEVSVYFVIYIYPVTVIKCRRILCTWINKRGLFELLSLCSRPINAAISTLCHTIPFLLYTVKYLLHALQLNICHHLSSQVTWMIYPFLYFYSRRDR